MRTLDGFDVQKRARRTKKRRRLSFGQKVSHIVRMMEENARQLTELRGVSGWGFSMSMIADMTAYERSTALMNDLHRACDEGYLRVDIRIRPNHNLNPCEYWFYTPEEHDRALHQGRLAL